jgi:hypothetical protein
VTLRNSISMQKGVKYDSKRSDDIVELCKHTAA